MRRLNFAQFPEETDGTKSRRILNLMESRIEVCLAGCSECIDRMTKVGNGISFDYGAMKDLYSDPFYSKHFSHEGNAFLSFATSHTKNKLLLHVHTQKKLQYASIFAAMLNPRSDEVFLPTLVVCNNHSCGKQIIKAMIPVMADWFNNQQMDFSMRGHIYRCRQVYIESICGSRCTAPDLETKLIRQWTDKTVKLIEEAIAEYLHQLYMEAYELFRQQEQHNINYDLIHTNLERLCDIMSPSKDICMEMMTPTLSKPYGFLTAIPSQQVQERPQQTVSVPAPKVRKTRVFTDIIQGDKKKVLKALHLQIDGQQPKHIGLVLRQAYRTKLISETVTHRLFNTEFETSYAWRGISRFQNEANALYDDLASHIVFSMDQ